MQFSEFDSAYELNTRSFGFFEAQTKKLHNISKAQKKLKQELNSLISIKEPLTH